MKISGKLNKKPVTLAVTIETERPLKIYLKVYDKDYPLSVYTNRYATINGTETFYVRMPLAPENAVIEVTREKNIANNENGFKVVDLKKVPLKRKLSAFNSANPVIKRFIQFCEEFCQKASYLSAKGSIYTSNDGNFRVDYLDDIIGDGGRILNTPARINKNSAIIQVSKKKFLQYTIPERMAILLHEFSHYYLNGDISNETEADLNALLIYLGLGYPRIDAYNVFTKVFESSDNEANIERMKLIDEFIRNFEKQYLDMTYDKNSLYNNYI
jgi:hypothetical protein